MACPPTVTKCSLALVMGLMTLACMPATETPGPAGGSGGRGGGAGATGGTRAGGSGGAGNTGPSNGGSGGSGGASGGSGGAGGSSSGGTGGAGGSTGGSGGSAGNVGSTGGSGGSTGGTGGGSGDARRMDTASGETPGTPGSAPKLSDVVAITKMRCAVAGCHDPIKKEHGMDLSTAATVFAGWVNKTTSDHCRNNMAVTRVVPSKPENSFVVTLIEAPPGRCAEVRRMPPAPMPQLPAAEVKVIRDWVAAGALND